MKTDRERQREAWEADTVINRAARIHELHGQIANELAWGDLQIVHASNNDKGQLVLIVEPVGDGRELPL